MPFFPPSWVPTLPETPNLSFEDFLFDEQHGRQPFSNSRPAFVCGLTGQSYDICTVRDRVNNVASALQKRLGWEVKKGSEWDKVIAVYSVNCIDYFTAGWSAFKLGGVVTPASAAYTALELERQLKDSGAKALFTCYSHLEVAKAACLAVGIPFDRIYILPVPGQRAPPEEENMWTEIGELVNEGSALPAIPAKSWSAGASAKRTAVLLYSSGTSGLPKGVMLTHRNLIANVLQMVGFEERGRKELACKAGMESYAENCLAVAPFSHIFGLQATGHVPLYRGDSVVVLPRYHLETLLQTIEKWSINLLCMVPPMLIDILRSAKLCQKYDLSSVNAVMCGASPIKIETCQQLVEMYPDWALRNSYGATEATGGIAITSAHDVQFGTCGSFIPAWRARIITPEGHETTAHDTRGELLLHGPSVFAGYLRNEAANKETFVQFDDGLYYRTGDEAMIQLNDRGIEHVVITERLKDLVKVKGLQVAPSDVEATLLTHPAVDDCAAIGVAAEREGELLKAFVVRAPTARAQNVSTLTKELYDYVKLHRSRHMWLDGGIEFVDAVPKSPSGKILRRILRDQEAAKIRTDQAKL